MEIQTSQNMVGVNNKKQPPPPVFPKPSINASNKENVTTRSSNKDNKGILIDINKYYTSIL